MPLIGKLADLVDNQTAFHCFIVRVKLTEWVDVVRKDKLVLFLALSNAL